MMWHVNILNFIQSLLKIVNSCSIVKKSHGNHNKYLSVINCNIFSHSCPIYAVKNVSSISRFTSSLKAIFPMQIDRTFSIYDSYGHACLIFIASTIFITFYLDQHRIKRDVSSYLCRSSILQLGSVKTPVLSLVRPQCLFAPPSSIPLIFVEKQGTPCFLSSSFPLLGR